MAKLEFGLFLEFQTFPDSDVHAQMQRYLSLVELAENNGFASVWAGESYPKAMGAIQHVSSPLLLLGHLAPRTSLALGTGVALAPVADTLKLAYDVALLDQLCGGRLTFGVGLGNMGIWKRFGIEPATIGKRMDETLLALKALWSGADGYEGEIVRVDGGIAPLPAQVGGPPIHVGGKIRRSARRAAEIGDGLTSGTHFGWPHVEQLIGYYHEALTELGRDPSDGFISANRLVVLAEDDETAWRDARPYLGKLFRSWAKIKLLPGAADLFDADGDDLDTLKQIAADIALVGSPETVISAIDRYAAAGVKQLQIRPVAAGMPSPLVERTIRLIGERIVPRFA